MDEYESRRAERPEVRRTAAGRQPARRRTASASAPRTRERNRETYSYYSSDDPGESLYNEYCYEPPKRNTSGKKGLNAALAVLCVCAIGISSAVGISLLRDSTAENISRNAVGANESSGTKVAPEPETQTQTVSAAPVEATSAAPENIPTITPQPAADNTLTIPEIVTKVSPSVVGISCIVGKNSVSGTGIIMSADGYVVTNAHVVSGASAVSVVMTDSTAENSGTDDSSKSVAEKILESSSENSSEKNISASIIGIDEQTDLAVLKIEKSGLVEAEFGSSSSIKVGEPAIVIGNPLGFDLANTVTSGIISATNRKLTIEDRTMNLIQTDASINSGNSGGPLINEYGQVIGITSAKVSSAYGEGLGFAIPIDEAKLIIDDLIRYGYVKGRPTLGLTGENINAFYAEYYGLPQGFMVRGTDSGSAAQRAGIQIGDIVVGIQGESITTMEEFNAVKEQYKAGDTITVSVYRDEEIKVLTVTLDEVSGDTTSSSAETSSSTDSRRRYNYNYDYGYDMSGIFGNYPF